jgi:UDP-N-acetylmuramoyl-L-alanyl-D-glutamate--2,6-diaminopimelate ligase
MNARAPKLAERAAAKSPGTRVSDQIPDPDIRSITADSRLVSPGTLFVALPGVANDGRRFIGEAIARGAAAILTDAEGAAAHADAAVPVLVDANPRRRLALIAAEFYGPQPKIVAAVTGTNGKTSTASFTRQLWADAGLEAASIGTLGIEGPEGLRPGAMTTPDPVTLSRTLADLAAEGIDHAVMEASSHGLDQYRLDGVRIAAGAFTNLTQDHLDYHKTMAAYLAAKLRLFEHVLAPGGTAVLNADIPEFAEAARVAAAAGHPVLDFGVAAKALRLVARHGTPTGQRLELEILGRTRTIELPLVGTFQAMNALAALGLAIATGVEPDRAIDGLTRLTGVRGRVELVATLPNGAAVFVDYAHTPDGLEKILTALRPHATGKLVVAFGAGGDRDPTKRPLMGAVCARLADVQIVTDDNPRSEVPATIRKAILAACPQAIEIGDRAAAIAHGVGLLGPGDVFVIAGKGHEQGQTVAGVVHPFDDAEVARAAIASGPSR